jgi:predicted MFS family arabinose efflux permease
MDPNSDVISQDQAQQRRYAVRVLAGGVLGMMVAMGIGRFAYTPVLPLMQRELGMTNAVAGWVASLNYLGYLAGAIGCALMPGMLRSSAVNVGALAACIASTFLMGATVSPVWWGVLRCTAGIASALLFVGIAVEVTELLTRHAFSRWVGALYGGIGLGIALSGIVVPLLGWIGGWRSAWFGMGAIAAALALAGVGLARKRDTALAVPARSSGVRGGPGKIWLLSGAYFCEGFGYIISATFIVAIIAKTPGLESFAPWSWVAVGLAAAPSTVLWQLTSRRIGLRPALILAHTVQAAGILISIRAESAAVAGLAAALFGGTFLGIVTLVMAEATRRCAGTARQAAAVLTACFGAGQVIAPPLAGLLADSRGGFALPLLGAAAAVALGGVLIALDRGFSRAPAPHLPEAHSHP